MYGHLDWSYCHAQANQRNIIKEFDDVQHSVKRYKDDYEKMMDKMNEPLKARRKK